MLWSFDLGCRDAFEVVKEVLTRAIPESQCFLMGSFPLRTYLPDSDIDIAVLVGDSQGTRAESQTTLRRILDALYCAAMQSEPQDASHTLRNISFVNAKTPVVRCTVGNVDLDVTVNQIGSLGAITFLEEADRFIGKQHLFKRSLLLLKVCGRCKICMYCRGSFKIRYLFLSDLLHLLCSAVALDRGGDLRRPIFAWRKKRHVLVVRCERHGAVSVQCQTGREFEPPIRGAAGILGDILAVSLG